jgi:hypothetical protein
MRLVRDGAVRRKFNHTQPVIARQYAAAFIV